MRAQPGPCPTGAVSGFKQISETPGRQLPHQSSFPRGLFSRQNGSRSGAMVSSQANPRAGFWVADGIFRALAQSQAGSWVNASLQTAAGVVWLADCF